MSRATDVREKKSKRAKTALHSRIPSAKAWEMTNFRIICAPSYLFDGDESRKEKRGRRHLLGERWLTAIFPSPGERKKRDVRLACEGLWANDCSGLMSEKKFEGNQEKR